MNSYTHEFIWLFHIWIHKDNHDEYSYINSYVYESYIRIHIWFHVTYEFIWFFHVRIHMFHEFIYEFGCTKVPDAASNQLLHQMQPATSWKLMNHLACCFATSTSRLSSPARWSPATTCLLQLMNRTRQSLPVRDNLNHILARFASGSESAITAAWIFRLHPSPTASLRFNFEYNPVPSGPRPRARPDKISSHDMTFQCHGIKVVESSRCCAGVS